MQNLAAQDVVPLCRFGTFETVNVKNISCQHKLPHARTEAATAWPGLRQDGSKVASKQYYLVKHL